MNTIQIDKYIHKLTISDSMPTNSLTQRIFSMSRRSDSFEILEQHSETTLRKLSATNRN